ncbi:C-type mannose receptor 2-like isoform X2 [Vanacampus margaritifer]
MMDMVDLGKMHKGEQFAWIGLYLPSWKWSSGKTFKLHCDYSKWNPGEQNKMPDTENCVLYDNEYWIINQCDQLLPSICNFNGSYVLQDKNLTWHMAKEACQRNNSELASVSNEPENADIFRLLTGQQKAWLGLNRDSWKWTDGSGIVFSRLQRKKPEACVNASCIAANIKNSAQWTNHDCHSRHPFICYQVVQPITIRLVRVRVVQKNSSAKLNQTAVLEQLQQSVQCGPANERFKLSWKIPGKALKSVSPLEDY